MMLTQNSLSRQLYLFDDEELGDLEKLQILFDHLPCRSLLNKLNKDRKNGRDHWTNQSMLKAYFAKKVFQISTTADLVRELNRNSQLRQMCEFRPFSREEKNGTVKLYLAPSESAFTRFKNRLVAHQDELDKIFETLVEELYEKLEDFGQILALDGKIIQSYAQPKKRDTQFSEKEKRDGRIETDADYTIKSYKNKEGKIIKKEPFYGFNLHLLADTTYELPVSYEIRPANEGERTVAKKLLKELEDHKKNRADYLTADKGYDGLALQRQIEEMGITPIIDKCNRWKEKGTRQYRQTDLTYNEDGRVYLVDDSAKEIELVYKGYDKSSDSLRYQLPYKYPSNKIYRIKREEDPLIFNKVARKSKKFKRLYKKRTAIERINGRIDRDFLFENHTIRGLDKMKLEISLSLITQLVFAVSKLRRGKTDKLASWVAS